jgi:hypothetical protein
MPPAWNRHPQAGGMQRAIAQQLHSAPSGTCRPDRADLRGRQVLGRCLGGKVNDEHAAVIE